MAVTMGPIFPTPSFVRRPPRLVLFCAFSAAARVQPAAGRLPTALDGLCGMKTGPRAGVSSSKRTLVDGKNPDRACGQALLVDSAHDRMRLFGSVVTSASRAASILLLLCGVWLCAQFSGFPCSSTDLLDTALTHPLLAGRHVGNAPEHHNLTQRQNLHSVLCTLHAFRAALDGQGISARFWLEGGLLIGLQRDGQFPAPSFLDDGDVGMLIGDLQHFDLERARQSMGTRFRLADLSKQFNPAVRIDDQSFPSYTDVFVYDTVPASNVNSSGVLGLPPGALLCRITTYEPMRVCFRADHVFPLLRVPTPRFMDQSLQRVWEDLGRDKLYVPAQANRFLDAEYGSNGWRRAFPKFVFWLETSRDVVAKALLWMHAVGWCCFVATLASVTGPWKRSLLPMLVTVVTTAMAPLAALLLCPGISLVLTLLFNAAALLALYGHHGLIVHGSGREQGLTVVFWAAGVFAAVEITASLQALAPFLLHQDILVKLTKLDVSAGVVAEGDWVATGQSPVTYPFLSPSHPRLPWLTAWDSP